MYLTMSRRSCIINPMDITWRDNLSVGVIEIDNQHKELIKRKHFLDEAIAHGRGAEELEKLCRFLEVYIVVHFELEEFYMRQHDYPGFRSHHGIHVDFVERFFAFKERIEKQGTTDENVRLVGDFIADWLSSHILTEDQEFGSFLKSRLGAHNACSGVSLNDSMVGYEKVYRSGCSAEDARMMMFVDGILGEGRHDVLLARGEQTAWLKVPGSKSCTVKLSLGTGGYSILTSEGDVHQNTGSSDFAVPSSSFRIIADEDEQRFTITVS